MCLSKQVPHQRIIIRLWCDIKRNLSTMKLSLDFKLKLRSNHLF
ncbi:hypothetical protein EJK54_1377 [Moraxella catarrhalis]|uniref:Uncharacterized protein n=1 Tax=Moraxella catarrhalis TaxID=480 RepID=A0ABY0BIW1_MORCA|nr:hypothetical protein AO367_1520 [Moraxella catarrhalis]OAV34205.1 hypothetical protein AO365_1425 [Moraxella catarrhalis]RUO15547.1 hypothetical protein EJK54_1377 [Moraxella catarrhalis]